MKQVIQMELQQRKPNRLKEYDYSQNGAYFITICVQNRHEILCKIVGEGSALPQNRTNALPRNNNNIARKIITGGQTPPLRLVISWDGLNIWPRKWWRTNVKRRIIVFGNGRITTMWYVMNRIISIYANTLPTTPCGGWINNKRCKTLPRGAFFVCLYCQIHNCVVKYIQK